MADPIAFPSPRGDNVTDIREHGEAAEPLHPFAPSNAVHARVGDLVLHAARRGIRRGLTPEDIIREIVAEYHVHLTLGELRLLLASRQRAERAAEVSAPAPGISD
jgi:hypothetical protein